MKIIVEVKPTIKIIVKVKPLKIIVERCSKKILWEDRRIYFTGGNKVYNAYYILYYDVLLHKLKHKTLMIPKVMTT